MNYVKMLSSTEDWRCVKIIVIKRKKTRCLVILFSSVTKAVKISMLYQDDPMGFVFNKSIWVSVNRKIIPILILKTITNAGLSNFVKDLITIVFVKQPLALSGSAKY